jgi:glycosyltransferase involved in cell wall biosynthesis
MTIKNHASPPLRVLYLSLGAHLRGPIPKIDPLLIKGLSALGCQITKGTWGRHADNEGILQKVFGRLKDIWFAFWTLLKMRSEVLYVATTLDRRALLRDIPLLLAVYLLPVKKVLIEHGSDTLPLTTRGPSLYKIWTRLLVRMTDAILLLSTEEMEIWKTFEPRGNYYRVDNPFVADAKRRANIVPDTLAEPNSKLTLLYAGRLIQSKGIFDVLDAMTIIVDQLDCHLLIAGDGENRDEIGSRIDRLNLRRCVTLLGYLNSADLANVYRSGSIFILPTYFGEGFPFAILEAMSYGLPVITTSIRGSRDHLQEGVHALFVQPQDPPGIAREVIRLARNPSLRTMMSMNNRGKVQDFAPEQIAPKYLEIFSKVTGRAAA